MSSADQGCVPAAVGSPNILQDSELESMTAVLKALAHPVRLKMVHLIRQRGELCVCEFERHFDLTQPTVSHHLRTLRESGLLRSRQDGTWVHHSIDEEAFESVQQFLGDLIGRHEASSPQSERTDEAR